LKIAFIDHYDSFSFNVLDWLQRSAGGHLDITRITCDNKLGLARLKHNPIPTVISPGPGSPADYPRTLDLMQSIYQKVPVLGICLGHQILGVLAGYSITRAVAPWHGTKEEIQLRHTNWLTAGLPPTFLATVYNSLVIESLVIKSLVIESLVIESLAIDSLVIEQKDEAKSQPVGSPQDSWQGLAYDTKNQLMILSHRELSVASVQFHPESFGSEHLDVLARNFLNQIKS
jgi:anthranilate/para-aminobenzoate synthase component II